MKIRKTKQKKEYIKKFKRDLNKKDRIDLFVEDKSEIIGCISNKKLARQKGCFGLAPNVWIKINQQLNFILKLNLMII